MPHFNAHNWSIRPSSDYICVHQAYKMYIMIQSMYIFMSWKKINVFARNVRNVKKKQPTVNLRKKEENLEQDKTNH